MSSGLPIGLIVEIKLKELTSQGVPYYIHQSGNHGSGLMMLKLNALDGQCKLITQQRNFLTDILEWIPALEQETVTESEADSYIHRCIARDPDLWVIEIEGREMQNPFED